MDAQRLGELADLIKCSAEALALAAYFAEHDGEASESIRDTSYKLALDRLPASEKYRERGRIGYPLSTPSRRFIAPSPSLTLSHARSDLSCGRSCRVADRERFDGRGERTSK